MGAKELELDVLYAGDAGSERETAFVEFLRGHVRSARTKDRRELVGDDLRDVDVLIVDGAPMESAPTKLKLDDVRVPTVLIGGAGGRLADEFALKLGWSYG